MGTEVLGSDRWVVEGNTEASDTNGISGTCWRRIYRGEELRVFHWYYVRHYRLLGRPCCVRISLGWKLFSHEAGMKHLTYYVHPCKGWSLRGN